MDKFPGDIKFKFSWRKYQQEVLEELAHHLDDNHLHIIAPPGSGKTILGLEVMLRLNKPTLIFAPTIAIRNQWIQRFRELFLQSESEPNWISRDIRAPKFLTVSTYQGLHAAFSGMQDKETDEPEEGEPEMKPESVREILKNLKALKIGTIVVDEAHHLKNAWWQSLTELKKELSPTVVGLTATPPYDVSHAEWQRYLEFNGPVDAEISVPALIAEGDLCPHQDLIYFSQPSDQESEQIKAHRMKVQQLFAELKEDQQLIHALESHSIFKKPGKNLEWIYTHLEFYSATLIFLHAVGKKVSSRHLKIIGDKKLAIPALDYEWMETLLTFYLYKGEGAFEEQKEHQTLLLNKLKRFGAIERKSINFRDNSKLSKYLRSSISKLQSIADIVEFEHREQKEDLRLVVLSDYIRKEFLTDSEENTLELNKLGVLPIFEKLRRESDGTLKMGVLTGSVIIVPGTAMEDLIAVAGSFGISMVETEPLPYDPRYLLVKTNERLRHDIVHIITQVFENGSIEVLVGTKSLLGEGWDAPSINTLILASFVGSYVLSNQMRGRAIRTDRSDPTKTSNVWHLVSIDPTAPDGGVDLHLLSRRFKSFVGISTKGEVSIENGIGRMDLPGKVADNKAIDALNRKMVSLARQREVIRSKWMMAIGAGNTLIEEIKVPYAGEKSYPEVKSMYLKRTLAYSAASLLSGLMVFGEGIAQSLQGFARHLGTLGDRYIWLAGVGVAGLLLFGRQAYVTAKLYIKYRDIAKDLKKIGVALVNTLQETGVFANDSSEYKVVAQVSKDGSVYCHLEGGSTYEKSTFISCLQEMVGTVDNPRYLIIRKSRSALFLPRKDYHPVPAILGKRKDSAAALEGEWKRLVGRCELVYTRTQKGRQIILKARVHSLAAQLEDETQRVNKWR